MSFVPHVVGKFLGFVGIVLGVYVAYSLTVGVMGKTRAPEEWVEKPHEQWPQIALASRAEFRGHGELRGFHASLVELDDGRVLAVTARHLLDGKSGVHPRLHLEKLDAALIEWTVYARHRPEATARLSGLHGDPARYRTTFQDCLLLRVETPRERLPARPLRIYRGSPPTPGTVIHVVASPAAGTRGQEIHPGFVVDVEPGFLRCRLETLRRPPDLSGAPVIDPAGHLVGIVAGEQPGPSGQPCVLMVHSPRVVLRRLGP